jgi:hypothetical protein
MSRLRRYLGVAAPLAVTMSCAGALAVAAPGAGAQAAGLRPASSPEQWTKISRDTGLSIASAGLYRTKDGKLHVVWPSNDGVTKEFSLNYSTVGGRAKLLSTGTVTKHWSGISAYPRLVAGPGGGIRLVFPGGEGSTGPFSHGTVYTATSNEAGKSWTLVNGSMSQSENIPLTDTAAATENNGTPVAAWGAVSALDYHVGVDNDIPSGTPDSSIGVGADGDVVGPTLINSGGTISAAWYNASGTASQGYWVANLLPKTAKVKAPSSGGAGLSENQPFESVAFAARSGGGEYLAYCVPSKSLVCSHVDLWKVGAKKAVQLPGSSTGAASHVAIAAGPGGHLWISWFDESLDKIRLVRTNAAATRFGAVLTIAGPAKLGELSGLQGESSDGPLDLIALATQNLNNSTPAYWDTQLFPALALHASKSSVSHSKSSVITFTVTDTGSAVAGVTVKFLGKSATTNAKGQAKFTVKKGTPTGSHQAVASKKGYKSVIFTVKVT